MEIFGSGARFPYKIITDPGGLRTQDPDPEHWPEELFTTATVIIRSVSIEPRDSESVGDYTEETETHF